MTLEEIRLNLITGVHYIPERKIWCIAGQIGTYNTREEASQALSRQKMGNAYEKMLQDKNKGFVA